MKLGIIGSRKRDSLADFMLVCKKVIELKPDVIVSGGCKRGGDRFAEIIADNFFIPKEIHHPDWNKYPYEKNKYAALFIRNTKIADGIDKLVALVCKERKGGTEDTIKKFLKSHSEEDLILL
jgi:hypothetical protein